VKTGNFPPSENILYAALEIEGVTGYDGMKGYHSVRLDLRSTLDKSAPKLGLH
jgi:hypothetical protein